MSEPGKRADGGVHTWIVCPDCRAGVRASRHSPEDCDSLCAAKAELAEAILKKKDAIIRWSRLYEEHGDVYRELAEANAKIEAARESDRVDLLLALGIAPERTDNSEDDQC